jgi:hypothetical protein
MGIKGRVLSKKIVHWEMILGFLQAELLTWGLEFAIIV